jgi:hypothetical protein
VRKIYGFAAKAGGFGAEREVLDGFFNINFIIAERTGAKATNCCTIQLVVSKRGSL